MIWSPNTCNCVIECQIDADGVDLDWIATIATCPIHSGLVGQTLLNQVLSDNRAANQQGN